MGNKLKFNEQGIVPVNTTEKEVFMDVKQPKLIKGKIYANTHLQQLEHHLFAVGFVAEQLYLYFYSEKKNQANASFIAGCLHDIGKLDPSFQDWVVKPANRIYQAEDGQHIDSNKFSFEKHPRHNEISALIFQCLSNNVKGVSSTKATIKHAIYWHHAKPFRTKERDGFDTYGKIFNKLKTSLGDKAQNVLSEQSINMLNRVCDIDKRYREVENSTLKKSYSQEFDDEVLANYEHTPLPLYKDYSLSESMGDYKSKVLSNAHNNEVRACLITADRWVSSLTAEDLSTYIKSKRLNQFVEEKLADNILVESSLESHIKACMNSFPDSLRSQ